MMAKKNHPIFTIVGILCLALCGLLAVSYFVPSAPENQTPDNQAPSAPVVSKPISTTQSATSTPQQTAKSYFTPQNIAIGIVIVAGIAYSRQLSANKTTDKKNDSQTPQKDSTIQQIGTPNITTFSSTTHNGHTTTGAPLAHDSHEKQVNSTHNENDINDKTHTDWKGVTQSGTNFKGGDMSTTYPTQQGNNKTPTTITPLPPAPLSNTYKVDRESIIMLLKYTKMISLPPSKAPHLPILKMPYLSFSSQKLPTNDGRIYAPYRKGNSLFASHLRGFHPDSRDFLSFLASTPSDKLAVATVASKNVTYVLPQLGQANHNYTFFFGPDQLKSISKSIKTFCNTIGRHHNLPLNNAPPHLGLNLFGAPANSAQPIVTMITSENVTGLFVQLRQEALNISCMLFSEAEKAVVWMEISFINISKNTKPMQFTFSRIDHIQKAIVTPATIARILMRYIHPLLFKHCPSTAHTCHLTPPANTNLWLTPTNLAQEKDISTKPNITPLDGYRLPMRISFIQILKDINHMQQRLFVVYSREREAMRLLSLGFANLLRHHQKTAPLPDLTLPANTNLFEKATNIDTVAHTQEDDDHSDPPSLSNANELQEDEDDSDNELSSDSLNSDIEDYLFQRELDHNIGIYTEEKEEPDDEKENTGLNQKKPSASWSCSACTFVNPSNVSFCGMCDTRKDDLKIKALFKKYGFTYEEEAPERGNGRDEIKGHQNNQEEEKLDYDEKEDHYDAWDIESDAQSIDEKPTILLWKCSRCTLINKYNALYCELCNAKSFEYLTAQKPKQRYLMLNIALD